MTKRTIGLNSAFSIHRQPAYGAALDNTVLTAAHPFNGFSTVEKTIDKYTNEEEYGKGHEYATLQKNLTVDTKFSRSFYASSYIVAYALAFCCGQITSEQPNSAESPTVYQHTIKPTDIDAINLQLPVTTMIEALHSGKMTKYRDLLFQSVTLSGSLKEHLKFDINFVGSGYSENVASFTMPSLLQVSFLSLRDLSFTLGGTNISTKITSFEFGHSNELAEDQGYTPGSGSDSDNDAQVRSMCLVQKRATTFKFKSLLDSDTLDTLQKNNTVQEIVLSAEGSEIDATYKHGFQITIPKATLKATPISEENGLYAVDVECNVMWDDTLKAPFQAVVTNTTPEFMTAPA